MSDSVAEHYMDKLEHQKAITESCTQTIEFLQKKVENQRRELKRRTHAIGDLVRIREENQRLKELLGKVHETVGGTIEVLNTDDAITDTLWYDEYCTVVDTLGSMQDCIKGVLREAAQPQKGQDNDE